jgi:hypothetical protein
MDKTPDAGFWIFIRLEDWILIGCYPYFIPAQDGIFDQHRASSVQYRFVK